MKDKLYYENPYTKMFEAAVVEAGQEENGQPFVVLNRTSFYPTGGGQPCDLGTVNDIQVIDVEEIEDRIHHRLSAPLPAGTKQITGQIDWQRRFDHMQQHTGQHILSASFVELFDAHTIAFHLGRERVTIDLNIADLTEEMVERTEGLANRVVFDNLPITARFVNQDELASMPLRKPPTVTENIRVVIIPDFDYNPCGGTHPARTAEVGSVKILGWERHRGSVRVEFICGLRVTEELGKKHVILRSLSQQLSSNEAELPDKVARLLAERDSLQYTLHQKEKMLLEAEAKQLLAQAETIGSIRLVAAVFTDRSMQELQSLGQQLTALDVNTVALLVSSGTKMQLVFTRSSDVNVPMNNLLKETLLLIDGKGGGNTQTAQGGGVCASVSPQELLDYAVKMLRFQEL